VRYERRAGADTAVKVMTDGILLRELQARPRARAPARSGLGSSCDQGLFRYADAFELSSGGGVGRPPR